MIEFKTVSLTTMKDREESLKDTIKSLIDQVDIINVYLHGYDEIPDFLEHGKICVSHGKDRGDLDKFHTIQNVRGWHFIVDDDLVFPETYIEDTIKFIQDHDIEAVYSYHGVIPYALPIASYYQDRYVFPCLDSVEKMIEVKIVSTGVLAYYSSEPINFKYENFTPNMSDIFFNIYLSEIGKKKYVIPHKAGYIKHTDKINMEDTIYYQNKDSDFMQTQLINRNPKAFSSPRIQTYNPVVSIVVVNSRGITDREKVKACYDSLRNQTYNNIQIVEIVNVEKMVTIGRAFNDGVKKALGSFILFVGDDDFIANDYVSCLVDAFLCNEDGKCVGVSSYLTIFDEEGKFEPNQLVPTGMWSRDWLLENPFKEYLIKFVDSEMFTRVKEAGKVVKVVSYNYGYFYRSHSSQVSGTKILKQEESLVSLNQEIVNKIISSTRAK